jgi:hypothetical protein
VLEEAERRGYQYDASKIGRSRLKGTIYETQGQLLYEWHHLQKKLKKRDPGRHRGSRSVKIPAQHPLFRIIPGDVREWERVK